MLDPRPESASHLTPDDVLQSAALGRIEGLAHGFFTRCGGVSGGIYRGLNAGIGSQDDPDAVRENRGRVARFLDVDGAALVSPWQVHSPDVVAVASPFAGERPKADALVTTTPGLALGVVTADCGPVLFCDPQARVIGAAHAGWKGAVGGVLEQTLEAMEGLGACRQRVIAVLGPTITQRNYEVGADRAEAVVREDGAAAAFFAPGVTSDKRLFDLPGLILSRLSRAGVAEARFVGRCTYGDEERFFSFRRTTHRGESDYGRQISAIALSA